MAKASVNVKIDSEVKDGASELLGLMGLDMTTAIEMFFRQVIAKGRIPFDIEMPELSQKQRILLNEQKNDIPVTRLEFSENNELSNFDELSEGMQDWIANG